MRKYDTVELQCAAWWYKWTCCFCLWSSDCCAVQHSLNLPKKEEIVLIAFIIITIEPDIDKSELIFHRSRTWLLHLLCFCHFSLRLCVVRVWESRDRIPHHVPWNAVILVNSACVLVLDRKFTQLFPDGWRSWLTVSLSASMKPHFQSSCVAELLRC